MAPPMFNHLTLSLLSPFPPLPSFSLSSSHLLLSLLFLSPFPPSLPPSLPLYSAVWDLVPYLDAVLEKRDELISTLPMQLQKVCQHSVTPNEQFFKMLYVTLQDLSTASFNLMTSSAKRRRVGPDVEVTEEGVVEMLVSYERREFPVDKTPKTSLYNYSR